MPGRLSTLERKKILDSLAKKYLHVTTSQKAGCLV